jgi:excisionase family DNA binding protein
VGDYHARGSPGPGVDEDTYTPAEAAKILRYTERHVRKLLADGELEGERDEESGRWRVYQHSVHAMLPDRPSRVERSQEPLEAPERLRACYELG